MKFATCALLVACSVVAVADEPVPAAAPPGRDAQSIARLVLRNPQATCYFIRTIRPAQSEPTATGFIKLQARLGPIEHAPDCTNIGRIRPSIPVQGPDTGAASGPVLTPVVNR